MVIGKLNNDLFATHIIELYDNSLEVISFIDNLNFVKIIECTCHLEF